MPTLVCADPETRGEKASPKAIKRPQSKTGEGVKERVGELDHSRVNERFKESGGLVSSRNQAHIPNTENNSINTRTTRRNMWRRRHVHIGHGAQSRPLEAMRALAGHQNYTVRTIFKKSKIVGGLTE